jgi:hypothetical protein
MRTIPGANGSSTTTLTFRVDRYDATGNRLQPIGVQMYQYRRGQLTDGDEVEVAGNVKHGTVIARRIRNLTTGSDVESYRRPQLIFFGALITIAALVVLIVVILTALR